MCWNKEVSLNTFLFSFFVLLLLYFNNKYTQYKIPELQNNWTLLFLASFIFMQLIEYFIWNNINNKFYNQIFSILALLLITSQPFFSLMMLSNLKLRNLLLFIYLTCAIPFVLYYIFTTNISSKIGKNGHLKWLFIDLNSFTFFGWLFFLLFSLFYQGEGFGLCFGIISLIISYYNYIKDGTVGSMWCWAVNLIMLYYAIYLLIYLPFKNLSKK